MQNKILNRGAGRKFGADEKNCSHSRIVASPYYGMKILVAAASDRANTVCLSAEKLCSEEAVSTGIVKYNFNSL